MLPGIGGAMLILFNRRASVGLMVRAPRPEALPEAMDCRLPPEEVGVCDRLWLALAVLPPVGVFGSVGSLAGGCKLLTLFCRDCVVAVTVDILGNSAPAETEGCIVVLLALLRLLVLANADLRGDSGAIVVVVAEDCCPELPLTILVSSPGPTDFRGGWAADGTGTGPTVLDTCVIELCRLARSDDTEDGDVSLGAGCCAAEACRPPASLCLKLCVRPKSGLCSFGCPASLAAVAWSSLGSIRPPCTAGKSLSSGLVPS
jgi:hypothetical protein